MFFARANLTSMKCVKYQNNVPIVNDVNLAELVTEKNILSRCTIPFAAVFEQK